MTTRRKSAAQHFAFSTRQLLLGAFQFWGGVAGEEARQLKLIRAAVRGMRSQVVGGAFEAWLGFAHGAKVASGLMTRGAAHRRRRRLTTATRRWSDGADAHGSSREISRAAAAGAAAYLRALARGRLRAWSKMAQQGKRVLRMRRQLLQSGAVAPSVRVALGVWRDRRLGAYQRGLASRVVLRWRRNGAVRDWLDGIDAQKRRAHLRRRGRHLRLLGRWECWTQGCFAEAARRRFAAFRRAAACFLLSERQRAWLVWRLAAGAGSNEQRLAKQATRWGGRATLRRMRRGAAHAAEVRARARAEGARSRRHVLRTHLARARGWVADRKAGEQLQRTIAAWRQQEEKAALQRWELHTWKRLSRACAERQLRKSMRRTGLRAWRQAVLTAHEERAAAEAAAAEAAAAAAVAPSRGAWTRPRCGWRRRRARCGRAR